MGLEIVVSLLAGIISMGAGGLASSRMLQDLVRKIFGLPVDREVLYSERLSKLTSKLSEASREVDEIIKEISEVSENRQKAVEALELDLRQLEARESQLRSSIAALQNTPIEVAEHFASLVSEGDKRSAKRDYLLFGAGVLVSTLVAIAIQLLVS